MNIARGLQHLNMMERNAKWWKTPLPVSTKLAYYPAMAKALARSAIGGPKMIRYLNQGFYYDNLAAPFTLQLYPYEINHHILNNLPRKTIKRVLDIGGNIGQFSATLNYALDGQAKIDVLEPNPSAFDLLQKNTAHHKNIRVFNVGLGEKGKMPFHFQTNKSGTGSVFRANTEHSETAKQIYVELIDNVGAVTGSDSYDLVKIDVEGYEFSLLQNLKSLKTKYLFMEVSLNRYKNFSHSELLELITNMLGKFDIIHLSPADAASNNFDMLLKFL